MSQVESTMRSDESQVSITDGAQRNVQEVQENQVVAGFERAEAPGQTWGKIFGDYGWF